MFAYCQNNPIIFEDHAGTRIDYVRLDDGAPSGFASPSVASQCTRSGGNPGGFTRKVIQFFKNTDEQVVLQSEFISFYKGIPVVRTSGDRSGFFGIIFLTRETNNRPDAEDIVRHEYGHSVQMRQLGIAKYTTNIFIPSWREWGSNSNYYSREVEVTADILGGVVSRTHSLKDISAGFTYLDISSKLGILAWATIK